MKNNQVFMISIGTGCISPENIIPELIRQVQSGEKYAGDNPKQSSLYFFTEKGALT
jgi:hypothetical protein